MSQHQVALTVTVQVMGKLRQVIAELPAVYTASARESVVYHYEAGVPYQKIIDLQNAASAQAVQTARNSAARLVAQQVFDALLPIGGVAVDEDPMSLFSADHLTGGLVLEMAPPQEQQIPIYAETIVQQPETPIEVQ